MKSLLISILLSALFSPTFATECENMGRATTTDQKNMAFDIAFKFLEYSQKEIISLETEDYVSWKVNQIGCMADIVHYAKIRVVKKNGPGKRCVTELDLYTKDFFVAQINYTRDYKPRNVVTDCYEENTEEQIARNKCEQMTACPRAEGGTLYRDISANCECRHTYDFVQYEDTLDLYDNFYSPKREFSKPPGVEDLF